MEDFVRYIEEGTKLDEYIARILNDNSHRTEILGFYTTYRVLNTNDNYVSNIKCNKCFDIYHIHRFKPLDDPQDRGNIITKVKVHHAVSHSDTEV